MKAVLPEDITAVDLIEMERVAEQSPLHSREDILYWVLTGATQLWRLEFGTARGILLTAMEKDALVVEGIAGSGGLLEHINQIVADLISHAKIMQKKRLIAYAKPWVAKRLQDWEELQTVLEKEIV